MRVIEYRYCRKDIGGRAEWEEGEEKGGEKKKRKTEKGERKNAKKKEKGGGGEGGGEEKGTKHIAETQTETNRFRCAW